MPPMSTCSTLPYTCNLVHSFPIQGDDDVDGDDDEEKSVVNSCRFLTQGRLVVSPRRGGTHAVLA